MSLTQAEMEAVLREHAPARLMMRDLPTRTHIQCLCDASWRDVPAHAEHVANALITADDKPVDDTCIQCGSDEGLHICDERDITEERSYLMETTE